MRKAVAVLLVAGMVVLLGACSKEDNSEVKVNRFTVTVDLANSTPPQTDPVCFLDLDSGKVYKVSEAVSHSSVIDLVYVLRYTSANDPMLISIGSFDGKPGYPISSWNKTTLKIGQFQNFNHTAIDKAGSSFTTSGFASIKTVTDLKQQVGSNTPGSSFDFEELNPNTVGNIVIFKTHQGKLGAYKVLAAKAGNSGTATLEIVIES